MMKFIALRLSEQASANPTDCGASLRKRMPLVLLGTLTIAILVAHFSLPLVGQWLIREDPIHEADAIAVLSGRSPQRALEAAELYRQGYAPEVWLTQPKGKGNLGEVEEISDATEDVRNFIALQSFGVPASAIRVLDTPIVNTADELNAIDLGLKESGDRSVIIVTNKAHTRRVYSLWGKYHAGDGQALIHAVSFDKFTPSAWWRTAPSRAQAIHELLGMINLWAGMPVHHPLELN